MRVRLGAAAVAAFAILACSGCSDQAGLSRAEASGESQGEMISAVGCPVAGAEPGCVTITAKGKIYDISGADPAIDLSSGRGVSLSGRAAGEVTACGAKLTEIQVDYLSLQCSSPEPPPS